MTAPRTLLAADLTDEEREMLTVTAEQLAEVRRHCDSPDSDGTCELLVAVHNLHGGSVIDRNGERWRGDLSWW